MIFVFRETRFFRNLGSFAKLRNSRNPSLMFAKHENRFVASFAKISRNEISSKTLVENYFPFYGSSLIRRSHLFSVMFDYVQEAVDFQYRQGSC
jgi:hypothetical protein